MTGPPGHHEGQYAFKFHAAIVSLRPGANVQAVARRLNAAAAAIPGGKAFTFTPPVPLQEVQEVQDLAVLRALGMTRREARLVVATQASLLAAIGLLFGVPLGIVPGRVIWRMVAGFTPLAYHPPLALLALLLVGPAALLVANALAVWPQQRAARLNAGRVLRSG